jgi:3-(3-hydroxy-phenyl)propionate hydroxylase
VADILVNEDKLDMLPQTVVQYCDPSRPTTYVVGPGNHRRWEFMLLPGETPEEMNREEAIWRLLGGRLAPEDGQVWRAATYVFHALVAEEWRRGRVFLAGDAAHMTPPFMAQGMGQGIRDATNLAWKLAMVLEGRAGDALLDTYQRERRPHVLATTAIAKELGRIICELDPAKAAERDARMLAERGDPPAVEYRQSLIPGLAEGALASEHGKPVGQRFPQPRIVNGTGEYLLDDVTGVSFRLVMSSELSPRDLPGALHRKIGELGGKVLCLDYSGHSRALDDGTWAIVETDGILKAWFREHGLVAALVRPDHYVFAVARHPSELNAMSGLLDRRLFLFG